MATTETARRKADAVTRMVWDARLTTTYLEWLPGVRHVILNQSAPGSSLREYWEYEEYIGCGGFGSVHLERCMDVEVLRGGSDYEDDANDGATNKIGSLRAVKKISESRGQSKLSGEFLHELHSLIFFSQPKVCSPPMSFPFIGDERENGYSHSKIRMIHRYITCLIHPQSKHPH